MKQYNINLLKDLKKKKKKNLQTNASLVFIPSLTLQLAAEPSTFLFVLSGKQKVSKGKGINKAKKTQLSKDVVIRNDQLTHSSITSPSPIILGPVSSGGFLRASRAASASAN